MQRQILVTAGLFVLCLSLSFIPGAFAGQYEVKKGDSLYSIAHKSGVTIRDLKQANELRGNTLKLNQILTIPEKGAPASVSKEIKSNTPVKVRKATYYTVKKGDTISLIAKKTGLSVQQITALNNVHPRNLRIGHKLTLSAPLHPRKKENIDTEEVLPAGDDEENAEESAERAALEKENQQNAELLGKWGSSDERKLLVRVATGFLGAPYRLGGSTVRGIDCSAFVRKMYQFFDINLPRTAYEQSHVGLSINRKELVEGDLVFFRTRRPVGHVGIYIGNNEFVHASSRDKVVRIDSLDTPYFYKRFVRAVRLKSLDENGV